MKQFTCKKKKICTRIAAASAHTSACHRCPLQAACALLEDLGGIAIVNHKSYCLQEPWKDHRWSRTAKHKDEVTCGFLHAIARPSRCGAGSFHTVPGTFLAVSTSKARAAPPFQLCHCLVPGDVSGSEVHTVPAEEKHGISLYRLLSRAPLALPDLDQNEQDPSP